MPPVTPAANLNAQRRAMRGQYDPNDTRDLKLDFYIYEAQATALAVGASTNDSVQIEADSDFILQKLTAQAIGSAAGAVQANPLCLIQITDTGSGRQMMSAPIPVLSFFGTGQLPFILPNPKKFMRNSTIQVAFTSYEPTLAITLRLAFIGYKIYTNL